DAQANVEEMAAGLEARGRTPTQARLRRRFLRFVRVGPGDRVLEVGCGTGVVVRDLAALVGRRGEVVGIDPSRRLLARARQLCRDAARRSRIALRLRHSGRAAPARPAPPSSPPPPPAGHGSRCGSPTAPTCRSPPTGSTPRSPSRSFSTSPTRSGWYARWGGRRGRAAA